MWEIDSEVRRGKALGGRPGEGASLSHALYPSGGDRTINRLLSTDFFPPHSLEKKKKLRKWVCQGIFLSSLFWIPGSLLFSEWIHYFRLREEKQLWKAKEMRKFTHINEIKPLTMSADEMISGFAPRWLCGLVPMAALPCSAEVQYPIVAWSLTWARNLISVAIL